MSRSDVMSNILKKIGINPVGSYKNKFYVVQLDSSDEYAKAYSLLNENAINTEYPNFEQNSNKTTTKVINYFEVEYDDLIYNIFLIADFKNDQYQIKIGEK